MDNNLHACLLWIISFRVITWHLNSAQLFAKVNSSTCMHIICSNGRFRFYFFFLEKKILKLRFLRSEAKGEPFLKIFFTVIIWHLNWAQLFSKVKLKYMHARHLKLVMVSLYFFLLQKLGKSYNFLVGKLQGGLSF
jgi:hypothetical protein